MVDCQKLYINGLTMYSSISVFLLFALVAFAVGGLINPEKFEAAKAKCIAETGIDAALVKEPPSMDGLADDKVKCFYQCMIKQHGGEFKADGSLDLAKTISNIPTDTPKRELIIAAVTACADKKGAGECETAHQIVMCLHEKKMAYLEDLHKHD